MYSDFRNATQNTLNDLFRYRLTTQLRSLILKLGKEMYAIDENSPSIEITINDTTLHEFVFKYMRIRDCERIYDSKRDNFDWSTETQDPIDRSVIGC